MMEEVKSSTLKHRAWARYCIPATLLIVIAIGVAMLYLPQEAMEREIVGSESITASRELESYSLPSTEVERADMVQIWRDKDDPAKKSIRMFRDGKCIYVQNRR